MVLRHNPNNPEINPFDNEPKETDAIAVSPSMAIRKYSAGPNHNATFANGGDKKSKTKPLMIPPITEAKVETLIASIAFPFLVNSYPSIADAADADVPGVRNKMAEKEPP